MKIDFHFYFDRTNIADCTIVAYPLKTGYLRKTKKSWKKGSDDRVALLFICKMGTKGYFTV